MLKEKSFYKEGLPINVITANIEEYPIHFHDDLEVVYVLEGSVILKNGYYTYTLKPGDIFILNDREIHSFQNTGEPNMVMMLQMDLVFFSKYYDNLKNRFFVTDMKDADDESLEVLRGTLVRIMLELIEKGRNYEYKVIENTHNLIACLLADFQYFAMEDGKFVNEAKNKGNKILAGRLNRITDYMYENYKRRLTLNEVAEQEHLSIYYLSHVIKAATGLSFQELLSFIRVEESEKLLLGTTKKIGAISEESGFSAVRYYIKYFIKWFGMHPSEYREKYTDRVSSREILAKYTLAEDTAILKAVKHQANDVYGSFAKDKGPKLSIITLNLEEQHKLLKKKECHFRTLLKQENMKPGALAYKMLTDLNETVIDFGNQYIISSPTKNNTDGLSILIYNQSDKIDAVAERGDGLEETLAELERINDETETLVKIIGLSGEYRISRYKFSKENIAMSYRAKLGFPEAKGKRDVLLGKWGANPQVSCSSITVSESLSVQSNLIGFSAELILIDPI